MLVVMLVLMVATASAAVSVSTVQSEIQAAGHDRIALQTRYVSETAMMTTLAWIDQTGNSEQFLSTWKTRPPMAIYAEPEIVSGDASRTTMQQQDALEPHPGEIAPINQAGTPTADPLGSFGPRTTYSVPAPAGYVVDMYDRMLAPAAAVPGSPVGGGPGSLSIVQFYITLTARARVTRDVNTLNTRDVHERRWTFGATVYDQPMYDSGHDSRAVIVTPPMIVSNN